MTCVRRAVPPFDRRSSPRFFLSSSETGPDCAGPGHYLRQDRHARRRRHGWDGIDRRLHWAGIETDSGLLLKTRPAIGGNIMATSPPGTAPDGDRPAEDLRHPRTGPGREGGSLTPPDRCFESRVKPLEHEAPRGRCQHPGPDAIISGGKGMKGRRFRLLGNWPNYSMGAWGQARRWTTSG